uniref:glutamate synthase (NADH) n=1 Tax=Tridacna squamosa TaxID=80830 RepID=A0A2P0VH77_TRISQ|nr:symbiodinium glutamate synthase [Tridacna squamosa]
MALHWDQTPKKQGLYDPSLESDACGVGAVMDMNRKKSRKTLTDARDMAVRMTHRGAKQAHEDDGDGVGIMISVPDEYLRSCCGFTLPPEGQYGVGNLFLPRQEDKREDAVKLVERMARRLGLQVIGWRTPLPVNPLVLGPYAKSTEPFVAQVFVGMGDTGEDSAAESAVKSKANALSSGEYDGLPLETRLFLLRRAVALRAREVFVCSLSCRTITYKGQFKPDQLFEYYMDLKSEQCTAFLALVHSRFSTNSFPSWNRAHPFRRIAHNGEINTLAGNRNSIRTREALMTNSKAFGDAPLEAFFPVDEDIGSDSALLDNVVELLLAAGTRDLAEVIMMVIPEAWQNTNLMQKEKKDFYKYLSCVMEPWDGPALVCFTDGIQFGATLDRNGLRPGRFYITKDQRLILASEVGVVDVPPEEVQFKGRLRPGKMLLVDFAEGRLIEDTELKMRYATKKPYGDFLKNNSVELKDRLGPEPKSDAALIEELLEEEQGSLDATDLTTINKRVLPLLKYCGYTYEKMDMLIAPMVKTGAEPLGSMGQDMPLACLSKMPRQPFDYFSQLFAQATNPPIDPIREANVMSLMCPIGPERSLLEPSPDACRRVFLDSPILCPRRYNAIFGLEADGFPTVVLDMTYGLNESTSKARQADRAIRGNNLLKERLDQICKEAEAAILGDGAAVLVLSHRKAGQSRVPVSSLLAVGALHQDLIAKKLRAKVALIVEAADAYEIHHFCCLLGFGCDAIYPYLCYLSLLRVRGCQLPLNKRIENFRSGSDSGILKVMSKMGISCLQSYKGAQLFQAVGLDKEVISRCFTGCKFVLNGAGFNIFSQDAMELHKLAFPERPVPALVDEEVEELDDFGEYHFRSIHETEIHMNTPDVIYKMQEAAKTNSADAYKMFSTWQNKITEQTEIRGQLEFRDEECSPVPLNEVEPAVEIVKRFCTGAASFGSISDEAHRAMAIAMNRIGGKSNTGEGGEDPMRFTQLEAGQFNAGAVQWDIKGGDTFRSKIKQVASGRFGVTAEYLANADELQIKLAQGAKPGEGGELPGHKVIGKIAETRKATPGVGLISPPPHHDMYSIEDVAQLIKDLKNANPSARISVKLVARIGIGVIASGVVKGKADHLTISGMSGGTGAAKWGSIKHCGLPWEIGLAETHQTLVLNGLRNRVTLQTDGQVRTGRDVVIAAMLGAEEIAMTTAPLITLGCIMMRKCHLNTCPVGVATQDPELRAKFTGQPEHLINFLFMVAEEAREIMASLGIKKFNDLIGRTDLLRPKGYLKDNPKTADLDFADLLKPAWTMESMMGNSADNPMFCCEPQDHELAHALDQSLVSRCSNALTEARGENQVRLKSVPINNVDRSVGGILSFEVSKKFGAEGLPEGSLHIGFLGSSGQSFGNFLAPGITFELEGDANDYIGKGLSGGTIIVYKPKQADYDSKEAIIAGNAALYGATSGKAFFGGIAAERFAVRNSGATAVCEGVGDHGCEYMTRGTVVVLGQMGQNFAAGMSGGVAFALDLQEKLCNVGGVHLEKMEEEEDKTLLKSLVSEHAKLTGSKVAEELLKKWPDALKRFTKVFPKEYKKALLAMKEKEKASAAPKEPLRPKSDTMDVEEAGGRPTRVQNPDKKKGFHEYERKAMPYRDHKDRHMDWEEVYASQSSKSQQWHNWMQTQTARCMDCGTPTCHSPNQGGGGCPLGNRIPTWNQLVHEGEWKRALERLLDTNNFPEFTGTTCPAPCEEACVLGINEKPVAIKTTELAIIEYGFSKGWIKPQPPRSRTGRRVCIIGSGPAGLAAAQQLNRVGHLVEVIERADRAGGLLMYGIPSMKLDKIEKVMRRIKLLQQEGIVFKCNTEVGRDVTLGNLCNQNDAVILATGATMWRDMRSTDGRHLGNIVQAMDFLTATQRKNLDTAMGAPKSDVPSWDVQDKRVIVIGGGDTAVDCVGTAIRLGAKSVLQFSRRDEAPAGRSKHTPWPCWADTYRVDYAHSEGQAALGRDPREYLVQTKSFRASSKDPSVVGAVVASKLTPSGKESGVIDYPAELVVLAMGFTGPDKVVDPQNQLARDQNSNYKATYGEYQAEEAPWSNLYACGDCRRGASLVVTAIAEGRDCAARVDAMLMGSTSLPRAAPLAANPTFYQMPQKGMEQAGLVKRHLRKHLQVAEVSDAFERGLLVENPKEPEAEGNLEAEPEPTPASPAAPAPAPAAAAIDPQMKAMQTQMTVMSSMVGVLLLVNAGLVFALARKR